MGAPFFQPNSDSVAGKSTGTLLTFAANNLATYNTNTGNWLATGSLAVSAYNKISFLITFTGNDAATSGVQTYIQFSDDGTNWFNLTDEDVVGLATYDENEPRYRRFNGANGVTDGYSFTIDVCHEYIRLQCQERGNTPNGGSLGIEYTMGR